MAILWLVVLLPAGAVCNAAPDILVADFEGADYGAWTVEGEAFGPGPAQGTLPNQMHVSGYRGKGLVNSYWGQDGTVGKLTSPPFEVQRTYIDFLIGGGMYPGEACINLLLDGAVVRTATGPNDRPGGTERLDWHSWDVAELIGKTVTIQIVDQCRGGWGHINIDHIIQSEETTHMERTFTLDKRYLNLPVKNGAEEQHIALSVGERAVREFTIELASGEPDFWVFLDVSPFAGQTGTLRMDAPVEMRQGFEAISLDDAIRGAEDAYHEKLRPQFHFSPLRGWNNDPNGLVFYKGEYHLFFQHNPYGWKWGNMHWGHAVSEDLVHWKQLPIAIYPHVFGDWVFSGSAAVDWQNTGGFRTGEEDVIVAAYTSTGRGEAIAFSNDRGRTFIDYEADPVVRHSGRDPKIIWYEPGGHWVMAVYDEQGDSKAIAFYTSPDLKSWEFQSRIEGYYECPELFELPVDGDPGNTRWVAYAADGAYALGAFDGKRFDTESGKHRYNFGNCFYASQTFSDIPAEDGRRIQIAWGTVGHPSMPFNQMMNFPVVLTLRTTEEGIRMFAEPVREIEKLHRASHVWQPLTVAPGENPLPGFPGDLFHIRARFDLQGAAKVGFRIRGVELVYDAAQGQLHCAGCSAPLKPDNGKVSLEVLVDRMSIEAFANSGRVYMPVGHVFADEAEGIEMVVEGGAARVEMLEVYELKSAW